MITSIFIRILMEMKYIALFFLLHISSLAFSQEDSVKVIDLDEITISFDKEIAYGDRRYFITDFHVGHRGQYVLMKRFSKYVVYYLDDNMNPKSELELDFRATKLFSDCLGYLHVLARDSIHQLEVLDDSLVIWQSSPIRLYHTYLKNCVGSNEKGMIYEKFRHYNQTVAYYQNLKEEQTRKRIYTVQDSVNLRSTLEQAREIEGSAYFENLRGGEIDSMMLRLSRDAFNQSTFFFRHVVRPVYNPLFVRNDTTHIFDHLNHRVVLLSDTGKIVRMIPINYHLNKRWEERVSMDNLHQRFFTEEVKGGVHTFCSLSSRHFRVINRTRIGEHPHIEKVIVYGGYLYYLYKEDLEDNLNKLFRQRLL